MKISELLTEGQEKFNIANILAGCTAGKLQSVGLMQVIPLLSDDVSNKFVSPKNAVVRTTGYGSLVFENKEDKPIIVPVGAQYVTKEKSQDHALGNSGFVKKKDTRTFSNARCVEQSQGGYMSPGEKKIGILPYALREYALKIRNQQSYNLLWESIAKFNAQFGLTKAGHITFFLDHFKKQLDEFVAEFEIVPKQVGAIILVDGVICGIERAPSYQYWNDVWEALIRECYGSQAILAAKSGNVLSRSFDLRPKMDIDSLKEGDPISKIREVMQSAQTAEEEMVKGKIRQLLTKEFRVEKDETLDGASLSTVSHEQMSGQVIKSGEQVLYASLTTAKDFQWVQRSSAKHVAKPKEFSI